MSAYFPVLAQAPSGAPICAPTHAPNGTSLRATTYERQQESPSHKESTGAGATYPGGVEGSGQFKFPAARSALWDRTPQDVPKRVRLAPPRVSLSPAVVALLASKDGGNEISASGGSIATLARVAAAPTGIDSSAGADRPTLLEIVAHSVDTTHGTHSHAHSSKTETGWMKVLSATCKTADEIVPPQQSYVELLRRVDAAAQGNAPLSLGEAMPMHCLRSCSSQSSEMLLRIEALVPSTEFQVVPLYALRVLPSALSRMLMQSKEEPPLFRTGYLSMEQTRKLVLLSETDPKAFEIPLVGVWVSGPHGVQDPFLWAACMRYSSLPAATATTVRAGNAFLLLLYSNGASSSPRLFECTPLCEGASHMLASQSIQIALPLPRASRAIACDLSLRESPQLRDALLTRKALSPAAYPIVTTGHSTRVARGARLPLPQSPPAVDRAPSQTSIPARGERSVVENGCISSIEWCRADARLPHAHVDRAMPLLPVFRDGVPVQSAPSSMCQQEPARIKLPSTAQTSHGEWKTESQQLRGPCHQCGCDATVEHICSLMKNMQEEIRLLASRVDAQHMTITVLSHLLEQTRTPRDISTADAGMTTGADFSQAGAPDLVHNESLCAASSRSTHGKLTQDYAEVNAEDFETDFDDDAHRFTTVLPMSTEPNSGFPRIVYVPDEDDDAQSIDGDLFEQLPEGDEESIVHHAPLSMPSIDASR